MLNEVLALGCAVGAAWTTLRCLRRMSRGRCSP